MTFAGAYAIFSGAYDAASHNILWDKHPEAGTVGVTLGKGHDRVMNMVECDYSLYATDYTTVLRRIDGNTPYWKIIYEVAPTPAYQATGRKRLSRPQLRAQHPWRRKHAHRLLGRQWGRRPAPV